MNIRIRKSAVKDLTKVTPRQKQKIHQKILELKNFPQVSNVKKVTNKEHRIVYKFDYSSQMATIYSLKGHYF